MKFQQFIQQLRFRTRTDEYTLSDEDIVMLYNGEIDGLALIANMPSLNEHWFSGAKEISLTGAEGYELTSDIIHIHKVELCIDDIWTRAHHYRMTSAPTLASMDAIHEAMEDRPNGYTVFGRKIYVLSSAPTTTNDKIRLSVSLFPEYIQSNMLADGSLDNPAPDTVGLPRIFHQIMMQRCVIAWKGMQDEPIPLSVAEKQYSGDMATVVQNLKMLDTQKKYSMGRRKLRDVYGSGTSLCIDPAEQQYEALLVDGDGTFLTI